ncbi:hypothetical protein G3O06_01830 [Burkholderia sp. Ac-20345]|uniref:hypothetical protein n=1 Tax=Burkholderia sp. Ac-20345 TaxID=2703891 RepID=UPI00197C2BF7|nr:hypothetical protein [Burkholderia sp. Ac-20345]MBN3776302.1 hypothetical protein [Burkholderia sp. Ac-20345]
MKIDRSSEFQFSTGIGDLKRVVRELPPKPRENEPRQSRTHSRLLVLTAAIAVSALLTWVCLDEILIQDRPVPAHR